MGSKIGKLGITLTSGRHLESNDVRLDPEEPGDWHDLACYAEALRRIASDGLVPRILRAKRGDLDINVEQCLAVLEQCRQRRITPDENLTSRLYGAFLEGIEKGVSAGRFQNSEPN